MLLKSSILTILTVASLVLTGCLASPIGWPENNAGVQAMRADDYPTAIDNLGSALHRHTRYGYALNNRGISYIRTGDYHKALDDLELVTTVHPNFAHGQNSGGVLYQIGGDDEAAEAHYRKAIDIKDGYVDPYFNLARLYYAREEYELGLLYVDHALDLYYDHHSDESWAEAEYLRYLLMEQLGYSEEEIEPKSTQESSEVAVGIEHPSTRPEMPKLHPGILGN